MTIYTIATFRNTVTVNVHDTLTCPVLPHNSTYTTHPDVLAALLSRTLAYNPEYTVNLNYLRRFLKREYKYRTSNTMPADAWYRRLS